VLGSLLAFVAVSAVVICTPGQDTALTIRNTLSGGRRCGVATAGGVALGLSIWTIAASVGVVALLGASEPAFRALRLAGAAYLVFLGGQSLVAAARGRAPTTPRSGAPTTPRRALRQGVVSNIGNPKIALFFASLLPQFAPEGHGAFAGFLALGFLFSAMTLTWLSLYAVVVHRLRELLGGTVRRILDAATGVVLVALGLRVADDAAR
jgi:threonine/homoserine/homoserine lactone efflux protein